MKYGMYYGRIKPVLADSSMTLNVGQRLGKLFTYEDSAVLPDAIKDNNVLMIHENEWMSSDYIYNKIISLFVSITTTKIREASANTLINTSRSILIGDE